MFICKRTINNEDIAYLLLRRRRDNFQFPLYGLPEQLLGGDLEFGLGLVLDLGLLWNLPSSGEAASQLFVAILASINKDI